MKIKKIFISVVIATLFLTTFANATTSETVKILRKNISISVERIQKASSDVSKALNKAESAKKWEAKNWTEIESAMAKYKSISDKEINTIDFNVAQLIKLRPSSYPYIGSFYPPDFQSTLDRLKEANQKLRAKYDYTNKLESSLDRGIKQVKKEMEKRTKSAMKDIVGVPKTDSVKHAVDDHRENQVIDLLDKLVGGAKLLYWGIKLNFGLYYYAKEMQADVKSIKSYENIRTFISKYRSKISTSINSSDQGINMLKKWERETQGIIDNRNGLSEKFKGYQEQAKEKEKKKNDSIWKKSINRDRTKEKVGVREIYPAKELTPLPASSYVSDAKSVLQSISLLVDRAMNGDDPKDVMVKVENVQKNYCSKVKPIRKKYEVALNKYNVSYSHWNEKIDKAWNEREVASKAIWKEWHRCKTRTCQDAVSRKSDAIDARFNAEYKAAVEALRPSAVSLEKALQELGRIGAFGSMVDEGFMLLSNKLENYGKMTRLTFYGQYESKSDSFRSQESKLYRLASPIYADSSIYNYNNVSINELESHVKNRLNSYHMSLEALKYDLQNRLDKLRYAKKDLSKALLEYNKKLSKLKYIGKKYQNELNTLFDKDSKLLARGNEYLYFYFDEYCDDGFKNRMIGDTKDSIKMWKEDMAKLFRFYKIPHLSEIKTYNFDTLISVFEKVISKVDKWQDMLYEYSARRDTAFYYMNIISNGELSYKSSGLPRKVLKKKMNKGLWQSLNQKIDTLKSTLIQKKIIKPSSGMVAWADKLPHGKLDYIGSQFYNHIARDFFTRQGRFIFNDDKEFKTLEGLSKKMISLYKQFDKISSPEWNKIKNISLDIYPKIGNSAIISFRAMPDFIQNRVQVKENILIDTMFWLDAYMKLKYYNVSPLTTGRVYSGLNKFIKEYPTAKKKHDEMLKKQIEENKKRQKAWEKAEKLRKQMENKKRDALMSKINLVHELYHKFADYYTNKDLSGLISLVDSSWESSGGSDINDLEDTLSRSFDVFDEINYSQDNLQIKSIDSDNFKVTYRLKIIGSIYDQDIEHKENSQVEEIVHCDDKSCKIINTRRGTYLLIK